GLIVGGVLGALLLVGVGAGALVLTNSGSEYTALPDDCGEAVYNTALDNFFEGLSPSLSGGFSGSGVSNDGSYGVLTCEGESEGVFVEVRAELFDLDHPQ